MQENSYHNSYHENLPEAHHTEIGGHATAGGAGNTPSSFDDLRRKVKTNIIIAWICIGTSIVLLIGFIILALISAGVIDFGSEKTRPTPELAKSVCERHGGEFKQESANNLAEYGAELAYSCGKENSFSYSLVFFNGEKSDEAKSQIKDTHSNESIQILEDSDEFKKFYGPTNFSLMGHQFDVYYENTLGVILAMDGEFAENLIAELGFPDRNRAKEYSNTEKSAWSSYLKATARNDLRIWVNHIEMYMTNNRGKFPPVDNNKFTSSRGFCNGSDAIDDYACIDNLNTDGEKSVLEFTVYESLAASPFANDQSALYTVPSNEIYVFYGTSCDGDKLVPSQNSRDFALARRNLNKDGIFCEDND